MRSDETVALSEQGRSGRDVLARVLGVDACKKGWVGLTKDVRGYFGPSIESLVKAALQDPLTSTRTDYLNSAGSNAMRDVTRTARPSWPARRSR